MGFTQSKDPLMCGKASVAVPKKELIIKCLQIFNLLIFQFVSQSPFLNASSAIKFKFPKKPHQNDIIYFMIMKTSDEKIFEIIFISIQ